MSVPSVHIAKDRLRNLLIADRLMCTPDMSERMTSDIYYTISKYIELKPEAVQIEITTIASRPNPTPMICLG